MEIITTLLSPKNDGFNPKNIYYQREKDIYVAKRKRQLHKVLKFYCLDDVQRWIARRAGTELVLSKIKIQELIKIKHDEDEDMIVVF